MITDIAIISSLIASNILIMILAAAAAEGYLLLRRIVAISAQIWAVGTIAVGLIILSPSAGAPASILFVSLIVSAALSSFVSIRSLTPEAR